MKKTELYPTRRPIPSCLLTFPSPNSCVALPLLQSSPKIIQGKGGHEKNKRGRLSNNSSSFHGRRDGADAEMLSRPRTVPDLLTGRISSGNKPDEAVSLVRLLKLTKLLLKVTVQRILGHVQVLIPPEATVEDFIAEKLRQYAKEARRPVLSTDAPSFDLHYSQFSLETTFCQV